MSLRRIELFGFRPRVLQAALVGCLAAGVAYGNEPPAWLAGCWQGETGTAAEQAFEAWTAPRAGRMLGISQTLRGSASGFEYMRIDSGAGGLRYVPQPGGQPAVEFTAERTEPQRVVFANPKHDFPKFIEYRRDGDRLEARLSQVSPEAEGRRVVFAFRRVDCDSLFAAR